MSFSRILIISPHPDDGELGAGGITAKFIEEGKLVYYAIFSWAEASVPNGFQKDTSKIECQKALQVLGVQSENIIFQNFEVRTFPIHRQEILDEMIKLNRKVDPDLVLVPSSHDTHQDHQVIYIEAFRAFKKTSSIWGYEHPWNNLSFTTDIFVKLEENHIEKKRNALKQYQSQEFRTYFDSKYVESLARTRGTQIDCVYAETFELVRLLIL